MPSRSKLVGSSPPRKLSCRIMGGFVVFLAIGWCAVIFFHLEPMLHQSPRYRAAARFTSFPQTLRDPSRLQDVPQLPLPTPSAVPQNPLSTTAAFAIVEPTASSGPASGSKPGSGFIHGPRHDPSKWLRKPEVLHVTFSTDCGTFQDWQSSVLFYSASLVGHVGPITRIASGCEPADRVRLGQLHTEKAKNGDWKDAMVRISRLS